MAIRTTIMLDPALSEKLRAVQAKMIRSSSGSVSFSRVVNLVIAEGIKRYRP